MENHRGKPANVESFVLLAKRSCSVRDDEHRLLEQLSCDRCSVTHTVRIGSRDQRVSAFERGTDHLSLNRVRGRDPDPIHGLIDSFPGTLVQGRRRPGRAYVESLVGGKRCALRRARVDEGSWGHAAPEPHHLWHGTLGDHFYLGETLDRGVGSARSWMGVPLGRLDGRATRRRGRFASTRLETTPHHAGRESSPTSIRRRWRCHLPSPWWALQRRAGLVRARMVREALGRE
jgi:hypothetical protein